MQMIPLDEVDDGTIKGQAIVYASGGRIIHGDSVPSTSIVRSDTLYVTVGGQQEKIALADIYQLSVRKDAPLKTIGLAASLFVTVILGLSYISFISDGPFGG
ncbi:hypothetical protein ACFL6R_05900 [Gemmatimonadota bacterium]